MYTLFITFEMIIAGLLVIVVLLQSSKGGGMAGITGGAGNFGTMFGSRRTADFLSKATWWLGGSLFAFALVINLFFLPGQTSSEQRESIIQGSNQMQQAPTTPVLPTVPTATEGNNSGTTTEEK